MSRSARRIVRSISLVFATCLVGLVAGSDAARAAETVERYELAIRDYTFSPPGSPAEAVPATLEADPGSHLAIVQFRGGALATWRTRLTELGVEVLRYLPHNAFIVRMAPALWSDVSSQSYVRWVGPLHPAYRIEGSLRARLIGQPTDAAARRYRIAAFRRDGDDKKHLVAQIAELGGEVLSVSQRGHMIDATLSLTQLAELVRSDSLMYVQRWTPPQSDMDVVRDISGANGVESVEGYDGAGLNAEVMDVGTQVDHQDFDTPPMIEHGGPAVGGSHGASTYGIVFGNGDRDGDGDGQALGLNPAAQGYYANSGVGDRMAHTLELNDPAWEAVFQTNSWGSARNLVYDAVSMEMDDIILQADMLIFQSQSNAGARDSRPQAWSKNIVSVGGFNHFDTADPTDDCWCNSGSIGPAEDGRIKPDLSHFYDATWTTTSGDGYGNFGGTSGATPITAGISGILYQMWADNIWDNGPTGASIFERRPHPATMKALLINTAEQHAFSGTGDDMARVNQGWGMANAQQAYDRATLTKVIDESSPLIQGESDSYLAVVLAGQPLLKVTLVYTDWPGAPLSTVNRVNDLSLQVIDPGGTIYWGNNGLTDGIWSTAGGSSDTLNNVENVFIENPIEGTWEIRIMAE